MSRDCETDVDAMMQQTMTKTRLWIPLLRHYENRSATQPWRLARAKMHPQILLKTRNDLRRGQAQGVLAHRNSTAVNAAPDDSKKDQAPQTPDPKDGKDTPATGEGKGGDGGK